MALIKKYFAWANHVRAQPRAGNYARFFSLLFVAAYGLSGVAVAAPAYVQSARIGYLASPSTIAIPFPEAQTAGNLNVLSIAWSDDTTTITGIADSMGNSYVLAAGPTRQSGAATQYLYYAKNIAPAAVGANTITISLSSASLTWPEARVAEYSGVDIVSPLDGVAAATGSGSLTDSGPLTTNYSNDLIVGTNYGQTNTTEAGSGFTERILEIGNVLQDRIAPTAGTYSSTAPLEEPGWWIMQAAAFKASAQDVQSPTSPGGLSAVAAASTQVNLAWSASSDDFRVTQYRIERCPGSGCVNFSEIATTIETSYSDTALSAASAYTYRVRAEDAASHFSSYSGGATATTLAANQGIRYVQGAAYSDMTLPTPITITYPAAQIAGDLNVVAIGWNSDTATVASVSDSAGNTYELAIGPTRRAEGEATQYIYYARNIVAAAAGTNTVTVTLSEDDLSWPAIRIAEYAGISTTDPIDVAVGSGGTGANALSGPITTTHANDLIVATNYVREYTLGAGIGYAERINYLGNILQDRVTTSTGTYSASAPQDPPGWWVMQAVAFKGAGQVGSDTEAPTAPSSLLASAISGSQIDLTWAGATDNVAVTGYRVERCEGVSCASFSEVATPAGNTFSDSGRTASTTYRYRVRAVDAVPNFSSYSNVSSATTPSSADTSPPTVPSGVVATATSSSQINLSWNASTDDTGVTGYRVERCLGTGCTTFAQIGTALGTTFSDIGRAPSTVYRYRVRAHDAIPNFGGYSLVVTATTLADTQAPTAPGNLTATSASSTQISLSWTAAFDDVGVTGYLIERCAGAACTNFVQVAVAGATTSYGDAALSPASAYRYRIRARDAGDNHGAYSNIASATTSAASPTHSAGAVTYEYDSMGRLKQVTVVPQ